MHIGHQQGMWALELQQALQKFLQPALCSNPKRSPPPPPTNLRAIHHLSSWLAQREWKGGEGRKRVALGGKEAQICHVDGCQMEHPHLGGPPKNRRVRAWHILFSFPLIGFEPGGLVGGKHPALVSHPEEAPFGGVPEGETPPSASIRHPFKPEIQATNSGSPDPLCMAAKSHGFMGTKP